MRLRSTVVAGSVIVLGTGALLGALWARDSRDGRGEKERSKVRIRLELPQEAFLLAQNVNLHVSVTNDGPEPVELPDPFHRTNWQPTYTLTGPAHPEGLTFSFRSCAIGDKRPAPSGVEPVLKAVAPGATLRSDIPLSQWAPLREPGPYEVTARLEWGNVIARSEPVRFTMERVAAESVAVGVNAGTPNASQVWVAWLHEARGRRRLYVGVFTENLDDAPSFSRNVVNQGPPVGANATDVRCTWTNYDRSEDLHDWRVWREGAALLALYPLADPQRLDLGAPPLLLLRPALMSQGGALDLFAVSADGRQLSLCRFQPPESEGAAPTGAVLWRSPLSTPPLVARSALAPPEAGSGRRVVLVADTDDALLVQYMDAADGARPGPLASVEIAGATAMPGAEPGLSVGADGSARASVLLYTDPGKHTFAVADLAFGKDGQPAGKPEITALGQLPAAPQAAAAGYLLTPPSEKYPLRREWVVLLEDRKVIHSSAPGTPLPLAAPPGVPLEMLVLPQATYLLVMHPDTGPEFAWIR